MLRAIGMLLSVVGTVLLGCGSAQARCAFVDVNVEIGAAPKEQCFKLDHRCSSGERWGCFKTRLEFRPQLVRQRGQPDMRETAAAFGYVDPLGIHWDVPAGFATDGASIPAAFKPIIGGSWDQRYVRAAVLHDFYIRRVTADPESVHRLFFHALLASGTEPDRAMLMYWAVRKYGPQWTSIDLAAYEVKRRANLQRIEQENERFRIEYERCLTRHLEALRLPARQRSWVDCPLDGRHQLMLDLVSITRDELGRAIEDYRQGKCRRIAEGKFDCSPPAKTIAESGSDFGACNYQCGVSLCCARATRAECAARAHSRFIDGEADACPEWASPAPKR